MMMCFLNKTRDCSSPPSKETRCCSFRFPAPWGPQDAIRGERFGRDDEVIEELNKWLRVQNSNQYKEIDAHVSGWRKAVQAYGEYVEKWGVCFILLVIL
jgi:hypothetical protein